MGSLLVRMSEALKIALCQNECSDHVAEFGDCVGEVEGPVDWGNGHTGPEINVRWKPSGPLYTYDPTWLEVVD